VLKLGNRPVKALTKEFEIVVFAKDYGWWANMTIEAD
jgi:hypothetical protein